MPEFYTKSERETNLCKVVLALCTMCATAVYAQSADKPSQWEPLQFLVGTWNAQTTAEGTAVAQSLGTYTFQYSLNGNLITRASASQSCKGPADFDCRHHDTLILYHDAGDAVAHALYADDDGHVIHYDITVPNPNTAILLSNSPGPRFRLVYQLDKGVMSGKFQFAPPGSSEFKSYLEWSGTRSGV
jgi:hypothetical protein